MKNNNHNLLQELSVKLDSVWRYDTYIEDAESEGYPECAELFRKLKEEDSRHVEMLRQMIAKLAKEERFE